MSRFQVSILPRAQNDIHTIFDWLNTRSPAGAKNWLASFGETLSRLAESADSYGEAAEATDLRRPLKQCLFKTKNGRTYRAVYLIENSHAYLLRVRGPGQPKRIEDDV